MWPTVGSASVKVLGHLGRRASFPSVKASALWNPQHAAYVPTTCQPVSVVSLSFHRGTGWRPSSTRPILWTLSIPPADEKLTEVCEVKSPRDEARRALRNERRRKWKEAGEMYRVSSLYSGGQQTRGWILNKGESISGKSTECFEKAHTAFCVIRETIFLSFGILFFEVYFQEYKCAWKFAGLVNIS